MDILGATGATYTQPQSQHLPDTEEEFTHQWLQLVLSIHLFNR